MFPRSRLAVPAVGGFGEVGLQRVAADCCCVENAMCRLGHHYVEAHLYVRYCIKQSRERTLLKPGFRGRSAHVQISRVYIYIKIDEGIDS